MNSPRRIYLDNAATSWPKPECVYAAVENYQRLIGAPAGRGIYSEASVVDDVLRRARRGLAALIGASEQDQILFTANGTESLNLAIHGILRSGDHVITSVVEHNSVLRPLRYLESKGLIRVTRVACDATGWIDPEIVRSAVEKNTRLIALTHASNVLGTIQDVAAIAEIAQANEALYLLDAAQSIGHLELDLNKLKVDFLAAPAHKGLLAPTGTGFLYVRAGREHFLEPLKQGGTGSQSADDSQPRQLPDRFESGSPNVSGIFGLEAAVGFLAEKGIANLRLHASERTGQLLNGLRAIQGIQVYGGELAESRVGVVSFRVEGTKAPAFAQSLAEKFGIQSRAGYHCAGTLHQQLGTIDSDGLVRLSIGYSSSSDDIDYALESIQCLVSNGVVVGAPYVPPPCVHVTSSEPTSPTSSSQMELARSEMVGEGSSLVAPSHDSADAVDALVPGLRDLWQQTLGDADIKIAVLDGPVEFSHAAFQGAKLKQVKTNAVSQQGQASIAMTHGTHVASIIFGQHTSAVRGVAPRCQGIIVPIFSDGPTGQLNASSQKDLAQAILSAVQAGAHIINISGGEAAPSGSAMPELERAIKQCEEKGILVIAAAGNLGCGQLSACDCVHVPGALPSVLTVGAMDRQGRPSVFSNCGTQYQRQGLLAPGEKIIGALPDGGLGRLSGTSFATPIVCGVAALLMSLQKKHGREIDASAVRNALLQSVDPCDTSMDTDCRKVLAGRLNVTKATQLFSFSGVNSMSQEVSPAACGCKSAPPTCQGSDCPQPIDPREPRQPQPAHVSDGAGASTGTGALLSTRSGLYTAPGRVSPACLEETSGELVYVIGQLEPDLTTDTNLKSMQQAVTQEVVTDGRNRFFVELDLTRPFDLLAYILGYRVRARGSSEEKSVTGSLHDARFVQWLLKDNDCPRYVIRPQGAFAEAAYQEIIRYLIDQLGTPPGRWFSQGDVEIALRPDTLRRYFGTYGNGLEDSLFHSPDSQMLEVEKNANASENSAASILDNDTINIASSLTGVRLDGASHVAIAGEICGSAVLRTGQTVPAISPSLRACANWNLLALIEKLNRSLVDRGRLKANEDELILLFSILSSMAEESRNEGKTPEDRALNFALTAVIGIFHTLLLNPVFGRLAGNLGELGFDGVEVVKSSCQRPDSLLYDVELAFYNQRNLVPSRAIVALTINVAEVNPYVDGQRVFTRR